MRVTVTGRHMELTSALRNYIESNLEKLAHHFDKVIDADVVLSVEKHRHIAEVNLHANGVRIHGKETSADMYASVDAVMNKLERQVRKYKDRINRHQPRTSREARFYQHALLQLPEDNGHKESVQAPAHREVQREKLTMKPMTVDEGVMQLDLLDEPFLVFMNAETSQVNVLYKHSDGTLGLIEPQF